MRRRVAGLYDLTVMLDAELPEDRRSKILDDLTGQVEAAGTLVSSHDWGVRRMAYEIDHRPEAHYRLLRLEAEPPLLDRVSHALKIADGVLRHRIIKVKPGSPPPTEPARADAERRRDDDRPEGRVAPRAAADIPSEEAEE